MHVRAGVNTTKSAPADVHDCYQSRALSVPDRSPRRAQRSACNARKLSQALQHARTHAFTGAESLRTRGACTRSAARAFTNILFPLFLSSSSLFALACRYDRGVIAVVHEFRLTPGLRRRHGHGHRTTTGPNRAAGPDTRCTCKSDTHEQQLSDDL